MVIVIHPEVLEEFKQRLRKQKQRGNLDWEMEILDEAIESGMLSDSVVDVVPAPSYEEMHDKADQVIWQQIKAAQAQWE
jgi:predicted nucleic acid-binding protein